jgi:2-polyprenyl-6-methoxyphenol hydroxylase-like FAD-dependent oxidoreductase
MAETIAVLVVGGGPVGLALACELHRHGVPCRIIDKNDAPQVWSKAAAVTPRTLEVLDDMGVGAKALAKGRPVHGMNLFKGTERLAHLDFMAEGTPHPFLLGLSQRDTEILLAEHLHALGGRLERSVTLTHFEQEEEQVTATLLHPDGSHEKVSARFLVGCDGAKSTVREILGLPFEGSTFEQNVIQGDLRVDLPFALDANEGALFLSAEGIMALLPLLAEGRYRVILPNMPDPEAEAILETFDKIARARAPEGARFYDPAWIVKFRFHGRIVPRYRVGPVFLAGDAAHIHSPVGGQGMNMGIQDAYNLGWKLALVVRGDGRRSLLDSYEPERRPVAHATVNVTDLATKTMMRVMALRSPIAEAVRNHAASFLASTGLFQERAFRTLGQLGVTYASSPIVGQHHVSIWTAEVGASRATEQPHVTDWIGFTRGIGPGERVPDMDLARDVGGAHTLFELLRGTHHTLLLFDGAPTKDGYENLSLIAERVALRCRDRVRVHVVVPRRERPPELSWKGSVVLDEGAALHRHFGCGSEALYLVRPDGYLAFRSQPAVPEKILGYLDTIFVQAG